MPHGSWAGGGLGAQFDRLIPMITPDQGARPTGCRPDGVPARRGAGPTGCRPDGGAAPVGGASRFTEPVPEGGGFVGNHPARWHPSSSASIRSSCEVKRALALCAAALTVVVALTGCG